MNHNLTKVANCRNLRLVKTERLTGRKYAVKFERDQEIYVSPAVYELVSTVTWSELRTAFTAFAASDRPDIVYLKSLYCFARDEGHPLKQQWFPALPAPDRTLAIALINQPLATQTAAPADVTRLLRRLEDYLRHHTEIHLD